MPRWSLALVLAAGVGLLFVGHYLGAKPHHPNVVFVLLDTLRADRVGGTRNGQPIMPFLSEFAKGGAYFTNAISPASWTRPALASLFTATYTETHHVHFGAEPGKDKSTSDKLSDDFETMPEYLRDAGFDNWGVQTNQNGSAAFGFGQGFPDGHYDFIDFKPGGLVTIKALKKLLTAQSPFFLYVHYVDPHVPYTPPKGYEAIFGQQPAHTEEDAKRIDSGDDAFREYYYDDADTYIGRQAQKALPMLSDAGKETVRYRYDAKARYMDDQVATLVRTIEGQYPDTIFVIVADHGEEFWERGGMGHGNQIYQESIHVPLLLRGPGVPVGEVDALVTSLGILPTLAHLLHLEARPQWQAADLFAQAAHPGPVFSWTGGSYDDGKVNSASVIDGNIKLIYSPVAPNVPPPTHHDTEVYDLAADPKEEHNLYPRPGDADKALLAVVEKHREDAAIAGKEIAAGKKVLTPEELQQLQKLGYGKKDGEAEAPPKDH